MAWGNLNDRENSFKNPLSYFSDNFLNRPTQFEDQGGQFQPSRYFSDETAVNVDYQNGKILNFSKVAKSFFSKPIITDSKIFVIDNKMRVLKFN